MGTQGNRKIKAYQKDRLNLLPIKHLITDELHYQVLQCFLFKNIQRRIPYSSHYIMQTAISFIAILASFIKIETYAGQ